MEGIYRSWQEKADGQGVSVFMLLLSVYGFPLGSWFALGSTFVSFIWINVIHVFFQVCVYSYMEQERWASHTGPWRSCVKNICLSPPLPLCLAED